MEPLLEDTHLLLKVRNLINSIILNSYVHYISNSCDLVLVVMLHIQNNTNCIGYEDIQIIIN